MEEVKSLLATPFTQADRNRVEVILQGRKARIKVTETGQKKGLILELSPAETLEALKPVLKRKLEQERKSLASLCLTDAGEVVVESTTNGHLRDLLKTFKAA